jgi:uncharacterized protein
MRRSASLLTLLASFFLAPLGCAQTPSPSLPPGVLPIGQVQGAGAQSPLLGEEVTVQGVVTAQFEGRDGFFLQSAAGEEDGSPDTSDGIFVRLGEAGAMAVEVGDRVRVTGTVVELGSGPRTLTAIEARTLDAVARQVGVQDGAVLPPPVQITAPPTSLDDWERLEGMRIEITARLTVSGQFGLRRFAELQVSFGGRIYQPTELHAPGPAADSARAANALRMLVLDDGLDEQWPDALRWMEGGWPTEAAPLRAGSLLGPVTGVVDVRRGNYLILPVEPVVVAHQAPRPEAPQAPEEGDDIHLRVAVLNVENLFNGDGEGGGFPTPRGAETPEAYALQQGKLVATLQALDAHVAALSEMENDGVGPLTAVRQFLDALNAAGPATDWRAVELVGPGTDAIRNAILYRASHVRPVGSPVVPSDPIFAWGSRPPLGQAFVRIDGSGATLGSPWLVVANHLKSKGGCPDAANTRALPGDEDQGDGQSCWNAHRVEAARAMAAWLATNPGGLGDGDAWQNALIAGDLNSYAQEDPIRTLAEAGWVDAFGAVPAGADARTSDERGPPPYSYVFQGQAGRLDHALLHRDRATRLVKVAKWHTNADEDGVFGYDAELARAQAAGRAPDVSVWRSSDHDPMVVTVWVGGRVPASSR